MSNWEHFDVKHQEMIIEDPDYDSAVWCAIRDLEDQIKELKHGLQSMASDRRLVTTLNADNNEVSK